MTKPEKIPPCNWLVWPGPGKCGRPSVGTIHRVGYCEIHIARAEMFGKKEMFVRTEMFSDEELRQ